MSQAHAFAATGQLERLAEQLQASGGACANVRDDELRTPLHWASFNGKSDAVQLLLRYGADLNAVDSRNVSPLMVACLNGHAATVALLLQCGARTDFRSTAGKTAESVASPDIQALLRRAPAAAAAAATAATTPGPGPTLGLASAAAPPPSVVGTPFASSVPSNLPPLAVAAMRPAALLPQPQVPSPSPRGPPMLQRTRAVSNNVAAASAAANPPSPAPSLQPLQPGSAAAGARRALTAVLAATAVAGNNNGNNSNSNNSNNNSAGDETAALRAQVGELSEKLQRANTQIAQLLERIAAERATNTRLHDRIRELGGVPPPVGGPPLSRHSISENIDAPKGLSPRSAAAAAAERQRASPPGQASSTSPAAASPQPPPRVAPRARSNSPPLPRAVRGPPPPVGPRLPNVLASSPPPMAGGLAGKRGSANSGVFEGQMDMDSDRDSDVHQTINDTSHYHSLAGVQLLDYGPTTAVADYGSVPKSEPSAGNNLYGTLPMPAQADLSHLYIMPQEDFF